MKTVVIDGEEYVRRADVVQPVVQHVTLPEVSNVRMCCQTCESWTGRGKDQVLRHGCRLQPPAMIGDSQTGVWPLTNGEEWCGEWKYAAGDVLTDDEVKVETENARYREVAESRRLEIAEMMERLGRERVKAHVEFVRLTAEAERLKQDLRAAAQSNDALRDTIKIKDRANAELQDAVDRLRSELMEHDRFRKA